MLVIYDDLCIIILPIIVFYMYFPLARIFQGYSEWVDAATNAIRHYAQMLEHKLPPSEQKVYRMTWNV